MRTIAATALACFCLAAQPPAFEVASFKRQPVGSRHGGFRPVFTPTSATLHNASLGNCISTAYGYEHWRVAGPNWRDYPTDVIYDIDARTSAPASEAQMRVMLQTLLQQRLGLEFHRETKDLPVYGLVVAKGGPKFRTSEGAGEPKMVPGDHFSWRYERYSMARLAELLDPPFTSRHTVDETGLAGVYDFTIDMGPYVLDANGKAIVDGRGAIDEETAYIQLLPVQLGLRLEKKTAAMEVMVIDRVEKDPAGN